MYSIDPSAIGEASSEGCQSMPAICRFSLESKRPSLWLLTLVKHVDADCCFDLDAFQYRDKNLFGQNSNERRRRSSEQRRKVAWHAKPTHVVGTV